MTPGRLIGYLSLTAIALAISACNPVVSESATRTPVPRIPPSTAAQAPTQREPTPEPPATSTTAPIQAPPTAVPVEGAIELIPLEGALASQDAEISGMSWYGDKLLILPQYPGDYPAADGYPSLFAIPKAGLLGYLDGEIPGPPGTLQIPIYNTQAAEQIPG